MTDIVHLNVGGTRYDTSYDTITSAPDSMLAALVQRWNLDKEREIFIDRDGLTFRHILNYLRDSWSVSLPDEKSSLGQIEKEADYYSLPQLHDLIQNKKESLNRLERKHSVMCKAGYVDVGYHEGDTISIKSGPGHSSCLHFYGFKNHHEQCSDVPEKPFFGNFDFAIVPASIQDQFGNYEANEKLLRSYLCFLEDSEQILQAEIVVEHTNCFEASWVGGNKGGQLAHIPKTWVHPLIVMRH